MKMKQLITIGMVAVSVGACAMTQNIAELGPDTYTVGAAASPARGGASTARSMALQEAANFCRSQGKQILVKNLEDRTTNLYGAGSADVAFRCLNPGDPELATRPNFQRTPDMVVETRNR
jgi:hypothetical protein